MNLIYTHFSTREQFSAVEDRWNFVTWWKFSGKKLLNDFLIPADNARHFTLRRARAQHATIRKLSRNYFFFSTCFPSEKFFALLRLILIKLLSSKGEEQQEEQARAFCIFLGLKRSHLEHVGFVVFTRSVSFTFS